jgi:hypothetical protein
MTFDRPYRQALPFDAAKAEILRMSGQSTLRGGGRRAQRWPIHPPPFGR